MIANVGNFHTLAFRLGPAGIEGVFEHHTGLLDLPKLEALLRLLADGSLKHADVFDDHGHGALIYDPQAASCWMTAEFGVVVTGPRRSLMRGSQPASLLRRAVWGYDDRRLLRAAGCGGRLLPELGEPIRTSLSRAGGSGTAPWDVS